MSRHFFNPVALRRIMLISGIVLVLLGICITFFLIKYQHDDCAYLWTNDINAFGKKYDSVWDCFISRSKGAVIISILLGAVPVAIGCMLIKNR